VRITQADATGFDAKALCGRAQFDAVSLSYSLSMMPRRPDVIANAIRCVRPGGRLHIVDFGRQERLPALWRQILFAWLARFHVEPVGDWAEVSEMISESGGMLAGQISLYRGYSAYLTATR
jgi:S-adenosylmethionine-diacylgycerolhomoserine-N-methlytransferase